MVLPVWKQLNRKADKKIKIKKELSVGCKVKLDGGRFWLLELPFFSAVHCFCISVSITYLIHSQISLNKSSELLQVIS
jgi:hypothetical protein